MANDKAVKRDLILRLHALEAVRIGNFPLKTGEITPVYFDLRLLIADPKLMADVSDQLWKVAQQFDGANHRLICGVPYTALPLATCIASKHDVPMLVCRKEVKDYGTKKRIEGKYDKNQDCLVIEDVVTYGTSLGDVAVILREHGLNVTRGVVLIDREQDAQLNLTQNYGMDVKSVFTMSEILETLLEEGKIDPDAVQRMREFVARNKFNHEASNPVVSQRTEGPATRLNGRIRAMLAGNDKRQPVCVAFSQGDARSQLAEFCQLTQLHKGICAVSLSLPFWLNVVWHQPDLATTLSQIAKASGFVILLDGNFVECGGELQQVLQASSPLRPDLITMLGLVGMQAVGCLRDSDEFKDLAVLLSADLCMEGALTLDSYKSECKSVAEAHSDVVCGLLSHQACKSTLRDAEGHEMPYWTRTTRFPNASGTDVLSVKLTEADIPRNFASDQIVLRVAQFCSKFHTAVDYLA